MSGPLPMIKAEEFAKKLSDEESVCNAGWIEKFKLCHYIFFRKVSGKARGVNSDTTSECLTAEWPNVRKGYANSDL
jgi:hypothetical protein